MPNPNPPFVVTVTLPDHPVVPGGKTQRRRAFAPRYARVRSAFESTTHRRAAGAELVQQCADHAGSATKQ